MCLRGMARLAACALPLESRPVHAAACIRTPIAALGSFAVLPSSSSTPRLGPNRPASPLAGPPPPRPPGSDSVMRPRSSLAVPQCWSSPRTFAPLLFNRARAPGFSKCTASQLITSWARHRRHQFLRTPPGLSWRLPGFGHTLAPLQRPPAHLTRRAADSHSFAVLAADAHG